MAIEHVVVLMLENRSFDHMLGFLGLPHLDGLTGNEWCDGYGGAGPVTVRRTTGEESDFITAADPGHDFKDVQLQLYGSPAASQPTMRGFVQSYANYTARHDDIMRCFDPAHVPVISKLARSFVVLDRWFCAVPSSTWPNRYFAHAATSQGWVDILTADCANLLATMSMNAPTIFNRLSRWSYDWAVYYFSPPQAATLGGISKYLSDPDAFRCFEASSDSTGHWYDGFEFDCANDLLPFYTFIEPQYNAMHLSATVYGDNSQHPPGDVRDGEKLIARVYNALRASPAWEKTLLVLTYDEHGGFYDHVPPPRVPPVGSGRPGGPSFDFGRLGPRVPTLLISPLVGKGIVDHGPQSPLDRPDPNIFYDHTSLIATVLRMIGAPALNDRDARARDFQHLINDTPRSDCPTTI